MTARPVRFWTDDKLILLRELWGADELSSSEIGRVVGCTGNAVVGMANRLRLRAKRRVRGRIMSATAPHLSPWVDDGAGALTRTLTA